MYSIQLPPSQNSGLPTLCNSGSAPVNGTINGQNVTLTVVAGTQTFTLTGSLSPDGSTMMGTYASTDGKGCGTAQTGLHWSATSVKPLSGSVQGIFHSVAGTFRIVTGDILIISNQNFPVSGVLTQGANIGASNATVTGTLTFQGYPCLNTASVNGQISGNSVLLQIVASNGLNVGQIGSPGLPSDTVSPVVFENQPKADTFSRAQTGMESTHKSAQLEMCLGMPGTFAWRWEPQPVARSRSRCLRLRSPSLRRGWGRYPRRRRLCSPIPIPRTLR